MMAELAWASWQDEHPPQAMMGRSTCSPTEYHRMLEEKTAAALGIDGLLCASAEALLALWHSRATANAEHLRS